MSMPSGGALRTERMPQVVEDDRLLTAPQVAEAGVLERFVERLTDLVIVGVLAKLVAEHEIVGPVKRSRPPSASSATTAWSESRTLRRRWLFGVSSTPST
jgi:hypothetical protein